MSNFILDLRKNLSIKCHSLYISCEMHEDSLVLSEIRLLVIISSVQNFIQYIKYLKNVHYTSWTLYIHILEYG